MVESLLQRLQKDYDRQRKAEESLIDLEAGVTLAYSEGKHPEFTKKEASVFSHVVHEAEVRLRAAAKHYEKHGWFNLEPVKEVVQVDFDKYYESLEVVIKKEPDYKSLAKRIKDEKGAVSCAVVYKDKCLDPKYVNPWEELEVKPGDRIIFYLRNNGEHDLTKFIKPIGTIACPDLQKAPTKQETKQSKSQTYIREWCLENQEGFHARPAALFVKTANRYDSDVTVEKDGNMVSGKSILGLITLEAKQGAIIKVTAKGDDSEECINELEMLVKSKFHEDLNI